MAKEGNNLKNGTRWFFPLVYILGSGVGASGGTYLYLDSGLGPSQVQELARPDPFTGTQGAALDRRISDLERRISDVEDRIRDDYLKDLADRLERLELR